MQQIKNNIKRRCYSLKKVTEEERNLSKQKRVKKLLKKIKGVRGESTKKRILLLFKLEKELSEYYIKEGNKYDKLLVQ